ncbi:hypothetical protein LTR95_017598 [Oleoguttula sp. CCFEE 5521]
MAVTDPQLNDYYVIKLNNRVWPIIICDETRMSVSEHDRRTGEDELAVVVLSCRQYHWVNLVDLRPYNPEIDYAAVTKFTCHADGPALAAEEEKRQRAFKEDVPKMEPAHFWQNFIAQEKPAARLFSARRMNSTSTSSSSSGLSEVSLRRNERKRSSSPTLDTTRMPEKRLTAAQREVLTYSEGPVARRFDTHEKIVELRARISDLEYIAVVGSRQLPVRVSKLGVQRIRVLHSSLYPSKDYGDYLPLTMIIPQITAKEFGLVVDFLAIRKFYPKLNQLPPRFEDEADDDIDSIIDAAKTISLAYHAASWLRMSDLQADSMDKLHAMGAMEGPALIGLEAGSHGCDAWGMERQSSLHEIAVKGMARDYLEIMRVAGPQLSKHLGKKPSLAEEIARRRRAG